MASTTILMPNRFDVFSKEVTVSGKHFELSSKNVTNELRKYYANNRPVYLSVNDELQPAGKIIYVRGLQATVELNDSMHGRFVSHMLYRAVEYNLTMSGLGHAITDDKLINFKIDKVIISDIERWF